MTTSPPEETQSEIATPKKKARQRAAARQKEDDKGEAVLKKETAAAPNEAAPKAKTARKRASTLPSRVPAVTAEERWEMIAAAAYYRAQTRGFEPGHEQEDWLLAEREINAILRC